MHDVLKLRMPGHGCYLAFRCLTRHCERSEAIQSAQRLDCFVASAPRNDARPVGRRQPEIKILLCPTSSPKCRPRFFQHAAKPNCRNAARKTRGRIRFERKAAESGWPACRLEPCRGNTP